MTDTEKFIAYVKKYPILYDRSHKDFKNASKKAEVWEVIAGEMNETSEVLRTKWKGLKDGFTKYKKQKKGSAGSAKTYANWCWGPHLNFFDNFTKKRQSTSNIRTAALETTASTSSPVENMLTTALLPDQNDEISQAVNKIMEQISSTFDTHLFTPTPSTSTSTRISHRASKPSQTRATTTKPDENIEMLLNIMNSKRTKKSNAVDDLFQSYAKTFKTFSVQTQTMLKVEMAKLFANAELREHVNQNQSPVPLPQFHSPLGTVDSDVTMENTLHQQPPTSPNNLKQATSAMDTAISTSDPYLVDTRNEIPVPKLEQTERLETL